MNIDDAGSSNTKDSSRYYVLSGTIIDEKDYKPIKQEIFQYKLNHFKDDYIDAEIHVHELYKSQDPFSSVLLKEKYQLLDALYETISKLPITIITVAIDKAFFELFYENWNLFNTAWSILFQRFDSYLENFSTKSKGKIRIDKSTKDQHKQISKIINSLQKDLISSHRINNVIDDPFFVSSESSESIQVSDAVGYCTLKHLTKFNKFEKYWNLILPKYYQNAGKIDSYGLNIFPNDQSLTN